MEMQGPVHMTTIADGGQCSTARIRRAARTCGVCVGILLFDLMLGTAWHEIVGHGLTAVAFGARITYVEVLGFEFFPNVRWVGVTGYFGQCSNSGVNGEIANALVLLCGSLSTWIVGVVCVVLLHVRRWRGWPRMLLIALSIWWLDLFLYTLPSLGIPRYFFWGHFYSEPYKAAVALGVPGPVFQTLVVILSAVLAAALVRQICRRGARNAVASCES